MKGETEGGKKVGRYPLLKEGEGRERGITSTTGSRPRARLYERQLCDKEGDKIASVFMPDSRRETNALGKPTPGHGDGTTEVGPCVGLRNVERL